MLRFQVNNSAIGLSPALLAQEEALAMMHSASDGMLASGLALSTTLIAQNGMNRAEEMRLLEVMVSAFNAAILVMLYGSYGVRPLQLFAAHNGPSACSTCVSDDGAAVTRGEQPWSRFPGSPACVRDRALEESDKGDYARGPEKVTRLPDSPRGRRINQLDSSSASSARSQSGSRPVGHHHSVIRAVRGQALASQSLARHPDPHVVGCAVAKVMYIHQL